MLAIGVLVGGAAGADTGRLVVELRRQKETEELGRSLAHWLQRRERETTLAEEACVLRNVATHRFYDKRGATRGE